MNNLLTTKEARAIAGGLSAPSKMPCYGYSIPARRCITGGKLQKVKNSICSICYALKGRYVFPNVLEAMEKRYQGLTSEKWVDAIVSMISRKRKRKDFFRWHDSGDLQGQWHLDKIVQVARKLPHVKFWLPTREYRIVEDYMRSYTIPDNLTIRLSAFMIDGQPPLALASRLGLTTSGVSLESFTCPAYRQNNECKDCRACWDKGVKNVSYRKH